MTEKMTYTGPHFIIGAIGAASHGKTELLRAILYVQAKKGLADYGSYNDLIDLAEPGEITTVEYKSQHNCFYTHIDCAGGDEYTENMVTAIARMEYAILVVSVTDGVTWHTYEHVRLARESGIRNLIVYMNKCDQLIEDPELNDYIEKDIRALLNEHGFDGNKVSVIRGSALEVLKGGMGENWIDKIQELIDALDQMGINLMCPGGYIPQSEKIARRAILEEALRPKPHVTIGAIGDSGHGKTMLAAAILKVQSGRLKSGGRMANAIDYADIAQGGEVIDDDQIVTITSTQVEYETPTRYYTHIDCPGRVEYTKNTVASMARMDGAILVVSVLDGVTAQDREHVRLAREAGIRAIVVYMNQRGARNDVEMISQCELDARALLNEHGFDGENTPVILGSPLDAARRVSPVPDIDKLLDALDQYIPESERF